MPEMVMISLDSALLKRLDSHKNASTDTYGDVIAALLDDADDDGDYLSEEDMARILAARNEVRTGKSYTSDEIRQMLAAKLP